MPNSIFPNYLYLINHIPKETLIFILSFPILATICAFLRQIIGIKLFSLSLVLILSYIFYTTEIIQGIVFFLFIAIFLTFFRLGIKKLRILYLSRIAILFSFISLLLFSFYLIFSFFKINELISIAPFSLILIIIINEKFIANQIRNSKEAWIELFETLIISTFFFFILNWEPFQKFLINYPIPIFIFIVLINIIIGKWKGLRLTEYFRFRKVFKYIK